MHSQREGFTIAIVGGGIGGLSVAIGLHQRNVHFDIYEAAPAFAEIGAGIGFGPNSYEAMVKISPDIAEGFRKHRTTNFHDDKKEVWFEFRHGEAEKEGQKICEVPAVDQGQGRVHRARYLEELIQHIPSERAHFNKRLKHISNTDDGRIQLSFEDGTSATADAVVGCDGIKSTVRKYVLEGHDASNLVPVFSGKYAYRGLVPTEDAVSILGEVPARNSQMWLGHGAHILTFPVDHGAMVNVVAFCSKEDGKWEHSQWVLPSQREQIEKDFRAWGASINALLRSMKQPDLWAIFDQPPLPTYYQGNLCLLGDAAHASTPHQGAGAGQALEDAFVLSSLIGDISDARDLPAAFAAYDSVRRPRSQKVVTTSRQAGELYEFQGPGVGDDEALLANALSSWYDWIWWEDLDEHLASARRRVKLETEKGSECAAKI